MEEFKERFIADALELLGKMEKNLLLLEEKAEDIELIEEIFRDLHSLKGASSMYGFEKTGSLIHLFENVYEGIKAGSINVNTEVINLSLDIVDFITRVLKLGEDTSDSLNVEFSRIDKHLQYILDGSGNTVETVEVEETSDEDIEMDRTFFIHFKLDDDFETRGVNVKSIFKKLNKLGTVISIPIKNKSKKTDEWEIFIVSKLPQYRIEDLFIFMMDIVTIEILAKENLFLNDAFNTLVQNNSVLKQRNNLDELKKLIQSEEEPEEIEKPEVEQKEEKKDAGKTANTNLSFLKVASGKLDEQMDLLSELVTAKAELRLVIEKDKLKQLRKLIESIDKITNNFRKNILNVRLVQIKSLYTMFFRLVRDMSRRLEKDVEFVARGLETELDKNIIDSLENPLTHLIRNSLDHGIETTAERIENGKTPKGKIEFNTFRSGSDIIIEIKDDGHGIDKKKIKEKAIDKGLINEVSELTDKQIYDLIFLPGFSTAQNLSEVSGRGVGMDAVKKSISQLRGEVEISSEKGKGTTTTIRLPMSLSIIDTLLVQSGEQFFSIPLPDVQKCTLLKQEDLAQSVNDQIKVGDELIPYINLREMFKINGDVPKTQKAVIINSIGKEVGLVVDKVIGEYQAVLKPFDGYLINKQYLTGASMLADGQLTVILDSKKLIEANNFKHAS